MRWWLRTSPTRWLLLSSGNMARNTHAGLEVLVEGDLHAHARPVRDSFNFCPNPHLWPHSQRFGGSW